MSVIGSALAFEQHHAALRRERGLFAGHAPHANDGDAGVIEHPAGSAGVAMARALVLISQIGLSVEHQNAQVVPT